jgi:putative oxidoreductase
MCHENGGTMHSMHGKMRDFSLLALRLAIAFIFIYSGYAKIFTNHTMASGMFGKLIGPESAGSFWAYFVGGAEFFGGLMVLLGVFATYAAAWLSVIMVVAIFTAHWGGPINGYFLVVSLLGGCLALLGNGAGRFRLVKKECCCPECKAMCSDKHGDAKVVGKGEESDECCGGNGGCCGDKK